MSKYAAVYNFAAWTGQVVERVSKRDGDHKSCHDTILGWYPTRQSAERALDELFARRAAYNKMKRERRVDSNVNPKFNPDAGLIIE